MTNVAQLFILVGEPDTAAAEECPDCGFDSLLLFPLTSISLSGVGPCGIYRACSRCWEPS